MSISLPTITVADLCGIFTQLSLSGKYMIPKRIIFVNHIAFCQNKLYNYSEFKLGV